MRTLVITDLHFGEPGALANAPEIRRRLEPELAWATDLVIAGDLFSAVRHDEEEAIRAASGWLAWVDSLVSRIVFLPGNHDLVMTVGQSRPGCDAAIVSDRIGDLLARLCPTSHVSVVHPFVFLQGVTILHGHQLNGPLRGYRAGDKFDLVQEAVLHARAALRNVRAVAELHEADRALNAVLADRPNAPRLPSGIHDGPTVATAAAEVASAYGLPSGEIVFGHTHQRLLPTRRGSWSVLNPGPWVLDETVMTRDPTRESAWPGGVVRIDRNGVLLRTLLDDMTLPDLRAAVAELGQFPRNFDPAFEDVAT